MAAQRTALNIETADHYAFDTTVPVAVIGAGACGLTAAIAAREAGAEVLVLERDARPFGSTGMSLGAICAAGSQLQKEAGIEDSPESLYQDILTVTRGQTDAKLARVLAYQSAPTVDWLTQQHGLTLTIETAWTRLGHRQPRLHAPKNRSGQELMSMLLTACERADINLLTAAHVTTLIVNAECKVLGLRIERPGGAVEEVGCEALILATCGFGASSKMVAEYIPELAGARYYGHEGNQGEGIVWGMALGARVADMGAYQSLGSLADPHALVMPHTLMIGGGVQVNNQGKRFEDELDDISGQALTILAQPDGVCWIVYDRRLHLDALDRFYEYQQANEIGALKQADTVAGLARSMNVPPDVLGATIEGVRELASAEARDEFGRCFSLTDRLEPPYYAVRVTGALFHTQGGLVVDESARVVDQKGQPLPNLFAGGGAARSVSGPGGWGYLPAMGLATAVVLGRLAGQASARLVRG